MATSVRKIYKNSNTLYHMELAAGENGLNNLVTWVHIIEDPEVSGFLNGHELVFTAGIMNKSDDWLLNFAKLLKNAGTSAFVVNIGPYVKELPDSLKEFCDREALPLFTIPWSTHMVEMTKDFCQRITQNETVEASVNTAFKNVIFGIGSAEEQMLQIERHGFMRTQNYRFVALALPELSGMALQEGFENIRRFTEMTMKKTHDIFVQFTYNNHLVLPLAEYSREDTEMLIMQIFETFGKHGITDRVTVGVSSSIPNLRSQQANLKRALDAEMMARSRGVRALYYDELDVYKLVLELEGSDVLRDYYNSTVGLLEKYDRDNGTNLIGFLRTYLENNGSPQMVANVEFVHRNTVNNMLKKIERISGDDLLLLENKVRYSIGFYVMDVIK